ncbi:hypothetical protein CcaverHIS002_0112660 [Cutaneotrichosporon cavernicola]|uniref:Protein-tyrosine-phosphatase n=1 Tax=Cutaneotrichosporon cavernicola TaxID=279322 RepID=A0AA48KZE3_9TREE|nr:uncharacterized protein CcaverHIS019_0112540 [Cutaneotrichosporon cavernicola]BEI80737.1 hypothetical protein CcaverHIS002_0112660 [Cutaneotrichosporon cavernicola]BEI88536.1 hypothetical protein CcaverHIS019_0112540 [Cutaneotrichosporon cavernicola]BEI96309.1 hypothetical protein CcaverHIS631_0112580 [Cutaneotrichosporon cavernicola]BEJ04080.1 hypothetical protein CcaverHIS641_0112550 [Cutaneotrichosporon cavernicola]
MASKTPASLIQVPECFAIVEPGVYRCASPTSSQVPFLQSLGLRTIISLTPEHPARQLVLFVRASGVEFVHLGSALFQPQNDWRPLNDEIVKSALEMILDVRSHPVLVIDPLGIHQTGVVFGCLRMLQGWNFASALSEYRAHSGPTKHRYCDETYIEFFDPDLINLPPNHDLPAWWYEADGADDGWVEVDPPPKEKKKKDKDKGKEGKEGEEEKVKEAKEETFDTAKSSRALEGNGDAHANGAHRHGADGGVG